MNLPRVNVPTVHKHPLQILSVSFESWVDHGRTFTIYYCARCTRTYRASETSTYTTQRCHRCGEPFECDRFGFSFAPQAEVYDPNDPDASFLIHADCMREGDLIA